MLGEVVEDDDGVLEADDLAREVGRQDGRELHHDVDRAEGLGWQFNSIKIGPENLGRFFGPFLGCTFFVP